MYSTLATRENSKRSGRIIGTHQKLDRVARDVLGRFLTKKTTFPSSKEILYFEGMKGPDGLKRKSPGIDEPWHFIIPGEDDGTLIKLILDHQYNLRHALEIGNHTRAAFEASWMAHAITDGLTPAHHFPLSDARNQLMTEKEFVTIFGKPIKGIMRGRNLAETARNNWLYWGANGFMSKHVAFEYGVAITMTALPDRTVTPPIAKQDVRNVDLKKEFYDSLHRITQLDMYTRFCKVGWTADLAMESKNILLPEIIRAIILGWSSAIPELTPVKTKAPSPSTPPKLKT